MKKKLWIIIIFVFVLGAVALIGGKISLASNEKVSEKPGDNEFDAVVLEIQDDYLIVEALEGQPIAGEVRVQIGLLAENKIPEIVVGDIVRIAHDGKMTMSIPPQMTAVGEIIVIEKQ